MKYLKDLKLNIKPVIINLYHEYVFEGPCRSGGGYRLTKEYDDLENENFVKEFDEKLDKYLRPVSDFNILNPCRIDRDETFPVDDATMAKFLEDDDKTDVYFVFLSNRGSDLVLACAQKSRKPVVLMPTQYPMQTICSATLLSRGLDFHAFLTFEDTVDFFDVLRAKKVLANLRVLMVGRFGDSRSVSGMDNFVNYEVVTDKLGVNFKFVNIHEYLDQMHPFDSGRNYTMPGRAALNPDEADMKEIEKLTDDLMKGAEECTMTREDVLKSVIAYYVTQKIMDAYDCNGFCAVCPDACATRRLNEERITYCLTHSLNNGCGIPSACEYDAPAVISKAILQALGHKPSYMGNTTFNTYFEHAKVGVGSEHDELTAVEDPENTVLMWHAVTNVHMHGFDTPDEPYLIHPFTDSGFGATMRYDFARDKGQEVTMCRLDPSCTKLFVAKGTIAGCVGYTDNSCSIGAYIHVANGKDYFAKQQYAGNHVAMVYTDCFDKICALGKELGLEVITA